MRQESIKSESRTERRKRELRNKIIQVAVKLFEQQGFEQTTMEQIAEEADVARKTLYNYFPVKEAIADEYVYGISEGLAQENFESLQVWPDTKSRLLAALDHTYAWVHQNPALVDVALRYRMQHTYQLPRTMQRKSGTQQLLLQLVQQGQKAGEIKSDLEAERIIMYIDLLRGAMVLEWLRKQEKYDLHEEISKLLDFIWGGISFQRLKEGK